MTFLSHLICRLDPANRLPIAPQDLLTSIGSNGEALRYRGVLLREISGAAVVKSSEEVYWLVHIWAAGHCVSKDEYSASSCDSNEIESFVAEIKKLPKHRPYSFYRFFSHHASLISDERRLGLCLTFGPWEVGHVTPAFPSGEGDLIWGKKAMSSRAIFEITRQFDVPLDLYDSFVIVLMSMFILVLSVTVCSSRIWD